MSYFVKMLTIMVHPIPVSSRRFSRMTGIPGSSLSQIVAGTKRPTEDILRKLSQVVRPEEMAILKTARIMDIIQAEGLLEVAA